MRWSLPPGTDFQYWARRGHSLRDLVEKIQKLLGRKLNIVRKDARESDVAVSIVSNVRAKEVLGGAPKISLDQGLEMTIAWWRAQMR